MEALPVNDVTQGRTWADGERDWVHAYFYPIPATDRGVWVVEQHGAIIGQCYCVDYPWDRCVREAPRGLILEFGVRAGASLQRIAAAARRARRKVYGFDWWKGLPHSADGFTKTDCTAERPVDLPPNVTLIDGLFSDTLEGFLEAHRGAIGFINLDCDLFSSSYFVLCCCVDRFVKGSLIALSDIAFAPEAQRRAWCRFQKETGQDWEMVGKNHLWGEVWRKRDG
jgi:hypothetical protein